jgi:opacity protein-like surface antigen
MTPIQRLAIGALATALAAAPALAADPVPAGFYGGIAMRDGGSEQGLSIGEAGNALRFTPALTDARLSQAFVFGGYRWRNDLALEAAIGSVEDYRLTGRGGVGLMLPGSDSPQRSFNVDVYGRWSFLRSFSLYGRLGYSQSDATPVYSTSVAGALDRRYRDGMNYGVGVRYDMTRSLGLKLEYARMGAHAGDVGLPAPAEADQVQFGLQFRF